MKRLIDVSFVYAILWGVCFLMTVPVGVSDLKFSALFAIALFGGVAGFGRHRPVLPARGRSVVAEEGVAAIEPSRAAGAPHEAGERARTDGERRAGQAVSRQVMILEGIVLWCNPAPQSASIYNSSRTVVKAASLLARCMGTNATFRAIHTDPAVFVDVRCLVAPFLLSRRAFLETSLENAGPREHSGEADGRYHLLADARLTNYATSRRAPSVTMLTLAFGLHDDVLTKPSDLEEAYAAIGTDEKDILWIHDTRQR